MPRFEASVPAINANSAEALRAKTMRVRQSWNSTMAANFQDPDADAAPLEQRPLLTRHETMRAYIVATGMALGLLAVWAALVPFVA